MGSAVAALHPQDGRRDLTGTDLAHDPGAGTRWCRRPDGVPQKAAVAWLIGAHSRANLNAHDFRNRQLETARAVTDRYFQIAGRNDAFPPDRLELGMQPEARRLHIHRRLGALATRRAGRRTPQPVPAAPSLPVGDVTLPVTMVSPNGHENDRGPSSCEACAIRRIDPPSEGAIRSARHDCNDGFGGSGSGSFDEAGHHVAMQSASLSMNRHHAFDIAFNYGSALPIGDRLLNTLRTDAR